MPLPGADLGEFECYVCGERVTRTNPRQFICAKRACKLARKREVEAARRRLRPAFPCEMCGNPLPFGRPKYHPECFKQKERERQRLLYLRRRR